MASSIVMASAEQLGQEHINLAELHKPRAAERSTDSSEDLQTLMPSGFESSSIHDSSAARPAPQLDGPSMPRSLQECSDWLKAMPVQTIAQCKPMQRLQSAMALLQGRSSRQQRQEVQQLLGWWHVSQKANGRKRKYADVMADLIAEVLEEARRLKRMQEAYEPRSLDASATSAGTCFSAIQTALEHGSIER